MASREEAKRRRREQIVRAARKLMRERGDTGFSMRALAAEAEVSIATPYNLFGSKQAIMFAVLEADMGRYQERLERLRADELEMFFKAVSLATTYYGKEPEFHRSVLFSVYGDGGREYQAIFSGQRFLFLSELVRRATEAGFLDDQIDPDTFAMTLGHMLFSALLEWMFGEVSLKEFETRAHYGFTLLLLGAGTEQAEARLQSRLATLQKRLARLSRDRVELLKAHATET